MFTAQAILVDVEVKMVDVYNPTVPYKKARVKGMPEPVLLQEGEEPPPGKVEMEELQYFPMYVEDKFSKVTKCYLVRKDMQGIFNDLIQVSWATISNLIETAVENKEMELSNEYEDEKETNFKRDFNYGWSQAMRQSWWRRLFKIKK